LNVFLQWSSTRCLFLKLPSFIICLYEYQSCSFNYTYIQYIPWWKWWYNFYPLPLQAIPIVVHYQWTSREQEWMGESLIFARNKYEHRWNERIFFSLSLYHAHLVTSSVLMSVNKLRLPEYHWPASCINAW
jgi:hypothetical protein